MDKILISACLLGNPVRYDGAGKLLNHQLIKSWDLEDRLVALCPEVAAGLPVPRAAAEICNGSNGTDVIDNKVQIHDVNGSDVTAIFQRGAEIALSTAQKNNCRCALLTDGSPSCGSTTIYDGSFSGTKIAGSGVVTALLELHDIRVFNESQIIDLSRMLDQ